MAAFIAVVTVAAARATERVPQTALAYPSRTAAGAITPEVVQDGTGSRASRAQLDGRLASALQAAVGREAGGLAVGVIDASTGAEAVYDPAGRFDTASIVKADVLAALLLQHQQGTPLGHQAEVLAAEMMENSSNEAATQLWNLAGSHAATERANMVLRLLHTSPEEAGYWGLAPQ